MYLNEPDQRLRTIRSVRLYDANNAPLPSNFVFPAGSLKLIKPDDSIANASSLPVPTPNSVIPNAFDILVSLAEISLVGQYTWQLHGAGLADAVVWTETVDVDSRPAAIWQLLRAGNQPVGSFGEILDQRISAIVAQRVAAIAPAPKPYSLIQGDLEPDMPLRAIDLDGSPANLSTALSIQLRWSKPGVPAVLVALTPIDLPTGQMKRVWGATDTDIVGIHHGQMVVTTSNGEITTYPRDGSHYSWSIFQRIL